MNNENNNSNGFNNNNNFGGTPINNGTNNNPEKLDDFNTPNLGVNTNGTFFNASSLGNVNVDANNQVQDLNGSSNINQGPNNNVPNNLNPNYNTNNVGTPNQVPPAYTNPQTINPNPMPGFESSNMIGATPPISLEPEKKPKKKVNKTMFVVIIIVVLFALGFGVYYILRYTNLLKPSNTQVSIETNDLEYSVGDTLSSNIDDYAKIEGTDSKNCTIDTLSIDMTKSGRYEYTVTCGETHAKGYVTVVDNGKLEVALKTVYIAKNSIINATDFLEESSENLTVSFVDEEKVKSNLTTPGTYEVALKIMNENKKENTSTAKLVVLEYAIGGYENCTSNAQNVSNTSAQMTVTERFAIYSNSNFGFAGLSFEEYNFKFTDETEYANLVAKYNTDKSITINNVTSEKPIFNNDELIITFTKERSKEDVINEFGESNMATYGTIHTYFKNTLGYTCVYDTQQR